MDQPPPTGWEMGFDAAWSCASAEKRRGGPGGLATIGIFITEAVSPIAAPESRIPALPTLRRTHQQRRRAINIKRF